MQKVRRYTEQQRTAINDLCRAFDLEPAHVAAIDLDLASGDAFFIVARLDDDGRMIPVPDGSPSARLTRIVRR